MFSFVKKEAYTLVVMANRTRYFANRLSTTPVHSNALHGTTILASQTLKCLDFWFHLMTRLLITPCTRCVSRELLWAPLDDFSTQLKVKLFYFRFLFTTLIFSNSSGLQFFTTRISLDDFFLLLGRVVQS